MANGRRYEVPDYQRDYSWTREQWEDLWAQRRWRALAERVPARDLPGFLRSYLNSRRPLVRQNRVYKTIREEVTEPGQVFELLDHLEPLAELSEALDDHHHPFWRAITCAT